MIATPNKSWVLLAVLSIGAFTTILNATLMSPLLTSVANDLDVSESAAGQLSTIFAVAETLVALLVAPWMSRFSCRTWLQGQAAIIIIATLFSAFAPGFGWLVAARVLAGLGGAVIMASCFLAADEYYPNPKQRGRAIGIIASATTVAIVAGLPALAQIEKFANWRWAIAFVLIPPLLLLLGAYRLPDTKVPPPAVTRGAVVGFRSVLSHRPTCGVLSAMVIATTAYYGWLTYFGAYAERDYGATANTLSALFLVAGIAEFVSSQLTPIVLQRIEPRSVFAGATVIMAFNLMATKILFPSLWMLFVSIVIVCVTGSAQYLSGNALLLDSLSSDRGTVMALGSAGAGAGAALGSLIGGGALALFGDYAAVYRLLGIMLLLAVLAIVFSARERPFSAPSQELACV